MVIPLLIAAATTVLTLDAGNLTLTVPNGVVAKRSQVNWETDAYKLYEPNVEAPILLIIVGGGSYDLHAFTKTCLNGRQAWSQESAGSGAMVVGDPGTNAVSASWDHLSGDRLNDAKAIVSSMHFNNGATC